MTLPRVPVKRDSQRRVRIDLHVVTRNAYGNVGFEKSQTKLNSIRRPAKQFIG